MLQKDALRQDIFLIGPPGPARRNLALAFCELTNREVEYIALSRDTTESDLKQVGGCVRPMLSAHATAVSNEKRGA
jgi:hypothetical protein